MKEQKVIIANTASNFNSLLRSYLLDGWKAIGSHQVITTRAQKQYSGTQHMATVYTCEYSQTIRKKVTTGIPSTNPME